MRWLSLGVSLVASVFLIIHIVFVMVLSPNTIPSSAADLPGSGFTPTIGILLATAAILALIGGILAFNHRRFGSFFLAAAAVITVLSHQETRFYGGLYLVSGILSFFVRRPSWSGYDDDYDDYNDGYEEGEEEDEPGDREDSRVFRNVTYGARAKGQAAGIHRGDREEYVFDASEEPTPTKIRVRANKVCPACGASVGVEHQFCFICGARLHVAGTAEREVLQSAEESEREITFMPVMSSDASEEPAAFMDADGEEDRKETEEELPRLSAEPLLEMSDMDIHGNGLGATDTEEDQEEFYDDEDEDEYDDESAPSVEPPRVTGPHRVFVRPQREEQPVPRRPVRITPDNSYQEFSNYTRRRKRKNRSLLRRIVAPLILVLAVGGIAWLLLGARKVPGPLPDPVQPGIVEPTNGVISEDPPENGGNGTAVPTAPNPLNALHIALPTRGVVTGSNVNVRSEHATSGLVLMKLNVDAQAELLDTWQGTSRNLTGPWYRIRSGEKEGWIYGQYFQPLDARDATLPAGYTAALLKSFGSDRAEITAKAGPPTRQTNTSLTWAGMVATFKNEGEVARLQITSQRHVLTNGVAVGASAEDLYRVMGYPSETKGGQLRYFEAQGQGVSISMKGGKVQNITVGNI